VSKDILLRLAAQTGLLALRSADAG